MTEPSLPDSEDPGTRLRRRAVLLPLLLVALAYANALRGGFVWDDRSLIEEQEVVRTLAPLSDYFTRMFWSDPMSVSSGYYRPLVTLGYAVEYALWDGSAEGFHLTNLLLHLVAVAWVFLLCRRAGASPLAAAVGASAFGLFPRLTESVAWISGRTDVMASAFALAALLVYRADRPSRRWGAAGLVLLGMLCKEVAISVVLGLAVLEASAVRAKERRPAQAARNLAPVAVALLVYGALRLNALRSDVRELDAATAGLPLAERATAALAALAHYAVMLVDALRPRLQIGVLGEHPVAWVLLGVAVLAAAGFAAWRWGGRLSPLGRAALAASAGALALVLHLVPLNLHTLASDRFLYVPVAMLAVALAAPIERATRARPRAAVALSSLALLAFAGATHLRNRDWVDEVRLWRAAERRSGPEDAFVQQQLGSLYMDAHRYEEALEYLRRSVRRESRLTGIKAYNNLALCLTKLGRHGEAISLFQDMVRQQPRYRRAHLNLAMAYARAGRFGEALEQLQRLEALAPNDPAVPELRALFQRSLETVARLPSPGGPERASVAETRAKLFQELGAPHEAALHWEAVLAAPDATAEQRFHAAGFLAFEGELDRARRALERLKREQPGDERLPLLEEELLARARLGEAE